MVSTSSSAGWLVRSIAARISPTRLVTPGRGLVVHHHDRLDGMRGVLRELCLDRGGVGAAAPVACRKSTSMPQRAAICRHRVAKWPVSTISTLSPGDSVLTIAASQAPVPEEGKMMTGPAVWKICLAAVRRSIWPSSANCGAAVVDHRHVHGAEHAIRHRARAWDVQEMTPLVLGHGFSRSGRPPVAQYCIQFYR